jgi:hypothetical protein
MVFNAILFSLSLDFQKANIRQQNIQAALHFHASHRASYRAPRYCFCSIIIADQDKL